MSKDYDVIVVGTGPGGITCGALLAKSGLKTLLVDQNRQVGGKSMTISRHGFRYEYWPIAACPATQTQFHSVLSMLGLQDKIELIAPDPLGLMHYETPSGEIRSIVISCCMSLPFAETLLLKPALPELPELKISPNRSS